MDTVDTKVRAIRHANGMSCETTTTYTYDANGHRRWCTDCGVELGTLIRSAIPFPPEIRVERGRHWRMLVAAFCLTLFSVGIALAVVWVSDQPTLPVPCVTPTTYGYPAPVVR